ncbi:YtxH domain-containing protein [Agrilactobacillus fermenti]|uniref:YtxH domain-containing protein n=1 Tax=Agrilactobacillus fermenti TaxID=2586909 RepID=UPI003A5C729D
MAKFSTGLTWGLIAGATYGLLTVKKTGAQRIQSLTNYVADVTIATNDFQKSLGTFKTALHNLAHETQTTAVSAVDDIQKSMKTFNFQTEPRIKQIKAEVSDLTDVVQNVKPS